MRKLFNIFLLIITLFLFSCQNIESSKYHVIIYDKDNNIVSEYDSTNDNVKLSDKKEEGSIFKNWNIVKEDKVIKCYPQYIEDETYDIKTKFLNIIFPSKQERIVNHSLKKSYFYEDSFSFNKELALISFVLANQAAIPTRMTPLLEQLGFENIKYYHYDNVSDINLTSYVFATKKIDDFNLVLVASRGSNYSVEWGNNFMIGGSNNHYGFEMGAKMIENDLIEYISKVDNAKLWTVGYSRGGALTNLLAINLMDKNIINENNLYTYTFEAPASIDINYDKNHDNIFNVINELDFVSSVIPEYIGLKRVGRDINIFSSKYFSYVNQFYELEEFTLLTKEEIDEFITELYQLFSPNYRLNYHQNAESSFTYGLALFFKNNYDLIYKFIREINANSIFDLIDNLTGDNSYEYIKAFLDKYGATYDEEKLQGFVKILQDIILQEDFVSFIINHLNLVDHIKYMHTPESIYALLYHYDKN